MSVCQCNFYSVSLLSYVDVTVYIPSVHNGDADHMSLEDIYQDQNYRTIYLLHGGLDDHSSWMRWTMVEEQAEKHNIALVMPSGENSLYVNAVHGLKYYDFIHDELPRWAEANFPLRTDRESRYIAGLSMGGYGALRLGLASPDRYAAVGSFSGVVDLVRMEDTLKTLGMDSPFNYDDCFGGMDKIEGSDDDLYALMKKCKANSTELPQIYIGCGTEDALTYEANKKFCQELKSEGFKVSYMEMPGGHEWKVWNTCIKEFIEMIDA